ncbi:MAG TPA: hypothetical protein VMM83_00950, partial [Longimicrobiales bacterium]|nr:hypothetical protein [Longimicrobiales bacterium]
WLAVPDLPASLAAEAADGSAVGAGDALLASLLASPATGAGAAYAPQPEEVRTALRRAVAAGTATLLSRGADLLTAVDVARVEPHVRVRPAG